MIELTVPGDILAALSLNQRLCWQARMRLTADYQGRTRLAWVSAGCPRIEGKARIHVTLRRGRAADSDNVWSACKAVLDGLTDKPGEARLLKNDGPDCLELGRVVFEVSRAWKARPETVLRVEAVG